MTPEEKWPNEVRLRMIDKSEIYGDPQIYQYVYYDGYRLQNEKIEKLQQELKRLRLLIENGGQPLNDEIRKANQ